MNGRVAVVVSLILALWFVSCTPSAKDTDTPEIRSLDSLLQLSGEINHTKIIELAELRRKRENSSTTNKKYIANSMLFDAFATYQSDSALKYVDQNIQLAKETGNKEWEARSIIDKAGLLAATGLLSQSVDLINSIDRTTMPDELLVDYYGQMIYIYSHFGNYTEGTEQSNEYTNRFYLMEREYKDSVMMVVKPSHPEYLWYKSWDVLGTDKQCYDIIEALVEKLSKSEFNTHQDAKDAYVLAKLYKSISDTENFKKYLALSAMADVRIANAEISSLQELAQQLYNEGDIDRAYAYIDYTLNKAIQLPNRSKAYSITRVLRSVYEANKAHIAAQQQHVRIVLIIVCVLAVILAVAIFVIIGQNRKLSRQKNTLDDMNRSLSQNNSELAAAHQQLNEANQKLKDLNADLKNKNSELEEANYVKEEYIGYVFTICSNYIGKLEALKNKIHTKVVSKQYKDLEKETFVFTPKEELKNFYRSFDSIFLHIYPTFIDDFNVLLRDDQRIYPKKGELLNTELRIYALVRLGITDSIKIADFLHCSAQTVYNYRLKMRNRARIAKENFADAVRALANLI